MTHLELVQNPKGLQKTRQVTGNTFDEGPGDKCERLSVKREYKEANVSWKAESTAASGNPMARLRIHKVNGPNLQFRKVPNSGGWGVVGSRSIGAVHFGQVWEHTPAKCRTDCKRMQIGYRKTHRSQTTLVT